MRPEVVEVPYAAVPLVPLTIDEYSIAGATWRIVSTSCTVSDHQEPLLKPLYDIVR